MVLAYRRDSGAKVALYFSLGCQGAPARKRGSHPCRARLVCTTVLRSNIDGFGQLSLISSDPSGRVEHTKQELLMNSNFVPSSPQALVAELKVRARLGLKALRAGDTRLLERARRGGHRQNDPAEWRLGHCLTLVARSLGFADWDQARRVLGGHAQTGDDLGAFWHAKACDRLLNHWFADLERARECLRQPGPQRVLLPYRRQFVVVEEPYLHEIGLNLQHLSSGVGLDLVQAYGSPAWRALCWQRLQASPDCWA